MGAKYDLGQPFRPRQKQKWWGLGWGQSRLSRYIIRTKGAIPPGMTMRANENWANEFAMFLLRELIPNRNTCASNFMKVIVALILNCWNVPISAQVSIRQLL